MLVSFLSVLGWVFSNLAMMPAHLKAKKQTVYFFCILALVLHTSAIICDIFNP